VSKEGYWTQEKVNKFMELGYDRSLDHQDRLRVATFIQDILIGKNKKYDE
jgi:hypothetical protein